MMIDWLLMPIDITREHDVAFAIAWHARIMVLAWGVIAPLAIIMARFFKMLPQQNWPMQLDTKLWWHSHWIGQATAGGLSILGLILALGEHSRGSSGWLHSVLGYLVLCLASCQFLSGALRGSKGGPTDPNQDGSFAGDHFDMTVRRIVFERFHVIVGYLTLFTAMATIIVGLWLSNAPRWMWLMILCWWTCLFLVYGVLQYKGRAFDTYQMIWGPDPSLPGNKMKKMGIGTVRPSDTVQRPNKDPHKKA